jgi:PucR family transcriptional regulator, purine catabolism regulatory protein
MATLEAASGIKGGAGMITVEEALRIALPPGTEVVAGEAGLLREVTWATRLRPTPPAFGHLEGGELVLLPDKVLQMLDDRLTLEDVTRHLVSFNVAAIAHVGQVTPGAIAVANEANTPLLLLPSSVDLSQLERDSSQLIMERRREAQREGQDVGRRLMELAIAGEPLPAMVRTLAELAGRPVVLESRDGRMLAFQPAPGDAMAAEDIEQGLTRTRASVLNWYRSVIGGASPAEPPHASYALDDRFARVVAPIIGRDGLLGGLSLIVPAPQGLAIDGILASRGAAACAVVLAREQAAAGARREIELNVLDEILDGALRSEVTLLQQAKRLGHDLSQPHVAIIARIDQTTVARARDDRWAMLEETLARRGARILWRLRNTNAEIIWPATTAAAAIDAAQELHDEITQSLPAIGAQGLAVSLSVGRVQSGLAGIRTSYQDAKQALALGRRLHGPGRITRFEELGVYRLIFAAEGLDELDEFHTENLAPLLTYDREHGGELLRTLEAFFTACCSPKEAAAILSVHRNTILYRLERIRDITGLDLDAADVRLRLHLALCVHVALYNDESEPSRRR